MRISGPEYIRTSVTAAADEIKRSIESSQMPDDAKAEAKRAIDETTFVTSEVPNTPVYWIAVGCVGALALIIAIGSLILTGFGNPTPEFLQTALATLIGALAGMVVPTPKAGV